MKHLFSTTIFLFLAIPLFCQDLSSPYNESQDFRSDLKNSLLRAQLENKHVLIQFGGNWCPWCLRFHKLVKGTPQIDSLMKVNYIYLLANVPKEKGKRNMELFRQYDYPNRFGYPVFIILDKNGKRLNTQDSEAFENPDPNVKGYDTSKVIRFLKMWTPAALDPATYQKK